MVMKLIKRSKSTPILLSSRAASSPSSSFESIVDPFEFNFGVNSDDTIEIVECDNIAFQLIRPQPFIDTSHMSPPIEPWETVAFVGATLENTESSTNQFDFVVENKPFAAKEEKKKFGLWYRKSRKAVNMKPLSYKEKLAKEMDSVSTEDGKDEARREIIERDQRIASLLGTAF